MQQFNSEIEIYTSKDGDVSFDVPLNSETVWLTQKQMAELFEKGQQTISEHLVNIYKEEEVPETATHRKIRLVQKEGNREVERLVSHYNLDVIISVGYRVKSQRGVQFRQWATSVLKDHLIKGVSINSQKLYEMEKLFQQSELKNSMRFAEIRETLKYLIEKDDPLTRLI
ncbi:DNA-binding protein [bacterium]|nr:DNA-binding protein [bacterium]